MAYSTAVQGVGNVLQHQIHISRVGKGNEAEAPRPTSLRVLHHHAVDNLAVTAEVTKKAVVGRFPAKTSNEHFPESDNIITVMSWPRELNAGEMATSGGPIARSLQIWFLVVYPFSEASPPSFWLNLAGVVIVELVRKQLDQLKARCSGSSVV